MFSIFIFGSVSSFYLYKRMLLNIGAEKAHNLSSTLLFYMIDFKLKAAKVLRFP